MDKTIKRWTIGRESRASTYFAVLFGSAVITILAIRGFLVATGYPQIGGDSLHIAHMLWGGIFMLLCIIVLLYFHGHRAKVISCLLGGVGFGFFIDELGKFITNDNDYFYQPAAMLIYVIFLLLWALFSWLDNFVPTTPSQKFIDSLTRLRDASIHGMTSEDQVVISRLLNDLGMKQDEQNRIFKAVSTYAPKYQPIVLINWLNEKKHQAEKRLYFVIKSRISNFVIYLGVTFMAMASLMLLIANIKQSQNIFDIYSNAPTFIELGYALSVVTTVALVTVGFVLNSSNRLKTLIWYRRAILVNIFGTQVFLFYLNQFTAAFGLIMALAILYILTVLINDYEKKFD